MALELAAYEFEKSRHPNATCPQIMDYLRDDANKAAGAAKPQKWYVKYAAPIAGGVGVAAFLGTTYEAGPESVEVAAMGGAIIAAATYAGIMLTACNGDPVCAVKLASNQAVKTTTDIYDEAGKMLCPTITRLEKAGASTARAAEEAAEKASDAAKAAAAKLAAEAKRLADETAKYRDLKAQEAKNDAKNAANDIHKGDIPKAVVDGGKTVIDGGEAAAAGAASGIANGIHKAGNFINHGSTNDDPKAKGVDKVKYWNKDCTHSTYVKGTITFPNSTSWCNTYKKNQRDAQEKQAGLDAKQRAKCESIRNNVIKDLGWAHTAELRMIKDLSKPGVFGVVAQDRTDANRQSKTATNFQNQAKHNEAALKSAGCSSFKDDLKDTKITQAEAQIAKDYANLEKVYQHGIVFPMPF